MIFAKTNSLLISLMIITIWNNFNNSPTVSDASGVAVDVDVEKVDGKPMKVVHYSRNSHVWSDRGIRGLLRKGRQGRNYNPYELDPVADSADLPSCIELCMIQNCYGAVQTAGTVAPTTAP